MASNMLRIETLSKDNFDTWKIHMKALLVKNHTWNYVTGIKVRPEAVQGDAATATAAAEWLERDSEAMSDIILAIQPSELKQIKDCVTSHELWKKLESIYQSKGPARKATLLKQIVLQRMCEGDDVRNHLRKFFDAVDKLNDMDVTINDDLLSILLLYSLPVSFEYFRCAIESRDSLPKPEALRIKIVEESDARISDSRNAVPNALVAERKYKNINYKRFPNNVEKGEKVKVFTFKCYRCKKTGHKAADCKVNRKNGQYNANKAEEPASLYIMSESNSCIRTTDGYGNKLWCLDSGCTSHMCKDLNNFSCVESNIPENLKLADNSTTTICAKGIVQISSRTDGRDKTFNLRDTLYVPDLRTNLLSVGKIVDKGHRVIFDKMSARVIDANDDTILIADRKNGLYYINESSNEHGGIAAETSCKGTLMEWHEKLGHLNIKDLREALKNGVIHGIDIIDLDADINCDICLQGKMVRKPFPKKSLRKTEPGEIIHSDVCGPMRVYSNGNARYFVTFIDDATRWCTVKFLRQKNEVFNEFQNFKKFIETQYKKKIKFLQSDNGTEYKNSEFDALLKKSGIQRRLTVPNNPEQNGVAERKNRTLIEMARCLLIQSGLPPSFWAEAVSTANFIRNKCPTTKLDGRTPHEAWTGNVPNVSGFEKFGCKVYCLNRSTSAGKFDPRGKKGIFLGYAEQSKGFRIWIPQERKVEISRDVKFMKLDQDYRKYNHEEFYQGMNYDEDEIDKKQEKTDYFININKWSKFNNVERAKDTGDSTEQDSTEQDSIEQDSTEQESREYIVNNSNDLSFEGELEPQNSSQSTHGPGRPRLIRTGKRGRPRKVFHGRDREQVDYACLAEISVQSAISSPEKDEWMVAMADELVSILKNKTWEMVDRPKDRTVIGSKLILRNKYGANGEISRRKARIVARGFSQKPGVDYRETFAPVARLNSIRLAIAFAAKQNMHIRQFDVTTAYLNGVIEEEIYMEMPNYSKEILEFIIQERRASSEIIDEAKMMLKLLSQDGVCRMKKALYGLKQAGRCWHQRLSEELKRFGVKPTTGDSSVYVKGKDDNLLLIIVYVDDILIMSRSSEEIDNVYHFLRRAFEIKELGDVKYCLGIEFSRNESGITLKQKRYTIDILERFKMTDCKPVATPIETGVKLSKSSGTWSTVDGDKPPYRELVGALMYLAVATRPDISHVVSVLSQFNDCFNREHWQAAKRVLRYLKGTSDVGITFGNKVSNLTGYVDADWASCVEDRRSYTGFAFAMNGGVVSWESRKQRTVALSSTEAEYMALSEASKEAIHLKRLAKEMGINGISTIQMYNDNIGAQKLAVNPIFHSRTKHIHVRHHFVREALLSGDIRLDYLSTDMMPADVLTKGLSKTKHWECLNNLGVRRFS